VRLTAQVPATSANLGPGFDCFGLALDLCNEVTIDTEAEPGVTWEGEGAGELPTDGADMVSRAMRFAEAKAAEVHGPGAPRLPRVHLHGRNRIPLQSGLGSSAAATVAGIALAYRALEVADPGRFAHAVFVAAAEMEGHPDNAAAAAFGGFTVVAGQEVARLEPHPGLRPVVLFPERVRVPTDEARRVLPGTVSRADAVFNVGHAALTMAGLLHDPERLGFAMRDRLHEDVRLALVPEVREVFEALRASGVPVCVSGSGPTLLAFELDRRPVPDPGEGWRVFRVPLRRNGVEILEG
jgi:homoserine kinase